jgi:hypothetical protein
MCTVSWLHHSDGYVLLCNRDEKRARLRAESPRVSVRNGVSFAAPVDGDFGGTWISVNDRGVALCLLNGPSSVRRGTRSRGQLVLGLADATSAAEAFIRIRDLELAEFLPFTLAALEPGHAAAVFEWDGRRWSTHCNANAFMPLTSSSLDPAGVRVSRRAGFNSLLRAAGRLDLSVLRTFHASHDGFPNAYSPCMHRDDAATVSFSQVSVSANQIQFLYCPGSPCGWGSGVAQNLQRRAA